MRFIPLFVFFALSAALVSMLLHKGVILNPGAAESEKFPALSVQYFTGLRSLSGTLDETILKDNVTLVNFFASWCAPCAAEMPELAALKKQFPALQIHGVAWNDEPARLNGWLDAHGNPFPTVWLDPKGDATIALGIRGIPESFIVDAQGMIRYRFAAPLTADMREGELGALIQTLLSEVRNEK